MAPQEQMQSTVRTTEDARGESIPVRHYARIVSTSTIADQVLIEIIEPERLLAVSAHTLRSRESRPYEDKVGVEHARDIETIIELRPDIVFINSFIDRRQVERLKEAGLKPKAEWAIAEAADGASLNISLPVEKLLDGKVFFFPL